MTAPLGIPTIPVKDAPLPIKEVAVIVPLVFITVDPPIVPEVMALPLTFPAVEIVANLVSSIPAAAAMSDAVTAPALIVTGIVISVLPLKLVAVPVTSPDIAIFLAV
jgi:hypothetical protein